MGPRKCQTARPRETRDRAAGTPEEFGRSTRVWLVSVSSESVTNHHREYPILDIIGRRNIVDSPQAEVLAR